MSPEPERDAQRHPALALWPGQVADGKSAALIEVSVEQHPTELVLRPLDAALEPWRWSISGLKLDGMREHVVLEIEHADHPGMLLSLPQGQAARRALGGRVRRAFVLPGGNHPRVYALVLIGLVLGLAGLGYWGVAPLSRSIARHVPLAYERRLGGAGNALFARQVCRSQPADAALRSLLTRLGGAPDQDVKVVNFSQPNAFTFPGGDILVTRGLLEAANSPDEVAGVLAHELAHVHQRHVMAQMVRSTILAAAWSATVGDYSGLFVVDPTTAFQIVNLRFSRADEASADHEAFELMRAANISLEGLHDFFVRMAKDYPGGSEWLSSHPDSQRRAEEAAAAAPSPSTTPALSPEDWADLQAACADREPIEHVSDLFDQSDGD